MLTRENFDFEPFIRRNLVESGTVFTQTILLCHQSLYIIDLHVK